MTMKCVTLASGPKTGLMILWILLVSFLLAQSARGTGGDIIINYPPDLTVRDLDLLSISLTVSPGSVDSINVYVNGRKIPEIVPDSRFECFSVPLKEGENMVKITAVKDQQLVYKNIMRVFRISEIQSMYREPSTGFRKDYFHGTDRPMCSPCHMLQPGDADKKPVTVTAFPVEAVMGLSESEKAASTCYSCHKRLTESPFIHGPSAVWSCLSCHDPLSEPKYSVKKPDTLVCFGCHLEQKAKWYGKKFLHGPFNTGKCAICHNPHASDYPYNLVRNTWDLCVGCHVEKGSGRHIVEGFIDTQYHPTRGKPDPLRKGQELTCASCHDPHAADNRMLWRLNVGTGFELCRACHGK